VPAATYAAGATITVGLAGDPTNWNPLAAGSDAAGGASLQAVSDAVLPSAFVVGPSGAPVLDSALLESARVTSSDPETVTYTLDPRAVWSDGVPVSAADFVYTWEADSGSRRFRDRGGIAFTPASTAGYADVASVSGGASPGQVVVRFSAEDPDWRALFSPLLPAHVAERVGFDHGFADPVTSLVSAGPFVVQSYQPGADIVLARNPAWWGPPANLSTVTVDFVDRPAVATASVLTDQLDAAVEAFDPAQLPRVESNAGLSTTVYQTASYDDLVFDLAAVPAALRQALAMTVDRTALAETAQRLGDTGAAPVMSRVAMPGQPGYTAVAPPSGGAAAAAAVLADAGYQREASGLVRNGRPVRLTLALRDASALSGSEVAAVEAAASALGVELRRTDAAADLVIEARSVPAYPSLLSGYGSDPALQADLAAADALPDGVARDAALARLDAAASAQAVDLPLLYRPAVLVDQTRYRGLVPVPGGGGVAYDIADWGIPLPG
jgi:peptide/nickel transport system substrate-binding protein